MRYTGYRDITGVKIKEGDEMVNNAEGHMDEGNCIIKWDKERRVFYGYRENYAADNSIGFCANKMLVETRAR